MPYLHIELSRKNDKKKVFEKYSKFQIDEAVFGGCAILEGGMDSGKQSLMFFVEDPKDHNRVLLVQTSADIMKMVFGAMRGFAEQCGEDPDA